MWKRLLKKEAKRRATLKVLEESETPKRQIGGQKHHAFSEAMRTSLKTRQQGQNDNKYLRETENVEIEKMAIEKVKIE